MLHYDRRVIVRTVLGDIAPGELGAYDAHEHLFLATPAQPGDECTDVDRAIAEARTLVDAGGRALCRLRSASDATSPGSTSSSS